MRVTFVGTFPSTTVHVDDVPRVGEYVRLVGTKDGHWGPLLCEGLVVSIRRQLRRWPVPTDTTSQDIEVRLE